MSKILQAAAAGLWLAAAPAFSAYLYDSAGDVVRNSYGECIHTRSWTIDQAIVGCDGKVAEVIVVQPAEFAVMEPVEPRIEKITLDAETYFAFDKAELKPEATGKLDAVVAALQGYDDLVAVHIAGHADRIGDEAYNRELAMGRAAAVSRYLVTRGRLAPDRITVVSRGESDPVVACEGERGQALIDCLAPNRRVELDVQATDIQ